MAARNGARRSKAGAFQVASLPSQPEIAGTHSLRLQSGDGAVFSVSMDAAKMSKILRQMIDDLSQDGTRTVQW